MPDGTKQMRLYSSPVNYFAADGTWQRIDNKLVSSASKRMTSKLAYGSVAAPIDVGGWHNAAGTIDATYAQTADSAPLMSMAGEGVWVTESLQGAAPVVGDANGDTVTYAEVFPDTDLVFRQSDTSVKESFVLRQLPASGTASYVFDLGLSPGLTPVLQVNGSMMIVDGSGAPQFLIPAPRVWDSSVDPETDDAAESPGVLTLNQTASGWTVTLAADAAWLADPARVFPVTVDPTFQAGWASPTADTTISQGAPTASYDSWEDTSSGHMGNRVGSPTGGLTNEYRSLVHFDLSPIIGLPVTAATLNLYWYYVNSNTADPSFNDYFVRRNTDCQWHATADVNDPLQATWNRWGATHTKDPSLQYDAVQGAFTASDIMTWIQGYASGADPDGNCGFEISTGADTAYKYKKFSSAEDGATAGFLRPYLLVTVAGNPLNMLGDDPHSDVDDGVNTGSGNFTRSETDFTLGFAGPDLELTRTYNSLSSRVGSFGVGWSTAFDATAISDPQGVQFILADGHREYYRRNPNGSFTPPPGSFATIVEAFGYTYLQDKSGSKWYFETATGRLDYMLDPHGHKLDVTWEASGRIQYLQVFYQNSSSVTPGPILDFDYLATNSTKQVDQVLTPAVTGTTQMVYRYQYSGTKLVYACDAANAVFPPAGKCTKYNYKAGTTLIASVVPPKGGTLREVTLTYDASQRVTSRKNGTNNTWSYSYQTRASTSTCPGTIDTYTTLPSSTTAVPVKQRSIYRAADGKLVCHIDESGKITSIIYDANGFEWYVTDPNGNTSGTVHDSHGNPTLIVDANSNTIRKTYDSLDRLVTECDARCDGTAAHDAPYKTTYHYVGNTTDVDYTTAPRSTGRDWSYTNGAEAAIGGGLVPQGLIEKEFDARGNATATYEYDKFGVTRKMTDAAGLVYTYIPDGIGRVKSQTRSWTGVLGAQSATTTTTYNAHGWVWQVTEPAVTNPVSNVTHQKQIVNTYDDNGNLIREDINDLVGGDAQRYTIRDFDNADREYRQSDARGQILLRHFDVNGRVDQVTDANGTRTDTAFTITGQPDVVTLRNYVADPIAAPTTFTDLVIHDYNYDSGGRKVAEKDARGYWTNYEYYANDDLKRVVRPGYVPLSGAAFDLIVSENIYNQGFLMGVWGGGILAANGTGSGYLNVTNYDYDSVGRRDNEAQLLSAGDVRTTIHTYDVDSNVLSTTLTETHTGSPSRTRVTRSTYDTMSRPLTTSVDAAPGVALTQTTYVRDQRGLVESTTDLRGPPSTWVQLYDVLDRPSITISAAVTVESPGSGPTTTNPATTQGFNTFGDQTHIRDANLNTTVTDYDQYGRRKVVHYPSYTPPGGTAINATESFSYDNNGNLISHVDRYGGTTDYAFDTMNRVYQSTEPLVTGQTIRGKTLTWYDAVGNVTKTRDQLDHETRSTYDRLDRVRTATVDVTEATGAALQSRTTTYDYDRVGNQVYVQKPAGEITHYTYDYANQLVQTQFADLAIETNDYWFGQNTDHADGVGRHDLTTYDNAGRVATQQRTAADASTRGLTTFGYDSFGNTTSVQNPRGFTTFYSYDNGNQLTQTRQETDTATPRHLMTTDIGHDANGNITRVTDGRGNITTTSYNTWNLPETRTVPATSGQPTTTDRAFTTKYDAAAAPVGETQPEGVAIARQYDQLGRLTSETGTQATTTVNRSYGYDLAGHRTSASHPNGTLTFTYNERGALLSSGGAANPASFTYDANGRPLTRNDAAGVSQYVWSARDTLQAAQDGLGGRWRVFDYNPDATTKTVDYCDTGVSLNTCVLGSPHAHRSYNYDPIDGNLTADVLTDTNAQLAAVVAYTYDANGNTATKVVGPSGFAGNASNSYTYDGADRLTNWTANNGTTTSSTNYQWDDASNRTAAGNVIYTYDERNRMTTSTDGVTYDWDARGALDSTTKNSTTTDYIFDPFGRQTKQGTTTYQYDSLDRVTQRGTTPFTYAGTEAALVHDGTFAISRTPGGRALAVRKNTGAAQNVLTDRHGDVTGLYTPAGGITDSRAYDPSGKVIANLGTTNPTIGYQGSYTDPTTNDVWMGARWYSPTMATFTAEDTIAGELKMPVTLNRYTYAAGNPLAYSDPDGRYIVENGFRFDPGNKKSFSAFTRFSRAQETKQRVAARERYQRALSCRACDGTGHSYLAKNKSTPKPDPRLEAFATVYKNVKKFDVAFDDSRGHNGKTDGNIGERDFKAVANPDNGYPPEMQRAAALLLKDDSWKQFQTKEPGCGIVSWCTAKKVGSIALEVGSFIPGVGDVISVGQAMYYAANGDWKMAAIYGGGAVLGALLPVGGAAVKSLAKRGVTETVEHVGIAAAKEGLEEAAEHEVIEQVGKKVAREATNGGNRVFWSGGDAAKTAAAEFAEANGAKTLEMTAVGRGLERLPYNRLTAKLWDAASGGFAATARGEANVFIGRSFRGAESTFERIEAPILRFKGNPIVQHFEDAW